MAAAPNPEYIQTLLETFKCFICMEKIRDAHLCPHCSKLCCYTCIRRWLTEQRSQCPHCRAALHLHEIVNCRWVEDLSEQLDCLNSTVTVGNIRQSQEQKCETHNEPLTVFCITCNTTICHRCALFDSSAHCGHSFRPIEEIYNDTLAQLGENCDNLKTKGELIKNDIKEIDQNIVDLKQAKENKALEIRTVMECMMLELEKDHSSKLDILITQKQNLAHEFEEIDDFLHDCDLEVSQMPMSQLVNSTQRIKNTIAAMQNKQTPVLKSVYPEFHCEVTPKYEGGTLVIKSFSEKLISSEPIYSLPIGCNGVSWRLKVYPNGNGIVKDRYLSVFLELTSGPPGVSRYEYRIEMINQLNINDPSKNVVRIFTSDFEIGECWGYNRYFRLDLLHNEGFLQRDSLLLKFSVRPPTYYQKCRDQQWYISKLEMEKSMFLRQYEELKKKIPAKVKPVSKEIPSPKKKFKIKIQSLLEEFKYAEATETPKKDEVQGISGEVAINLVHPPLSIQTLYDSDFQDRFQGETAQSMFERLNRLFKESDNLDKSRLNSSTDDNEISLGNVDHSNTEFYIEKYLQNMSEVQLNSPKKLNAADNLQMFSKINYEMTEARFRLRKLENDMHNSLTESPEVASETAPVNLTVSKSGTVLHNQITPDQGLHNPIIFKNETTLTQETDNPSSVSNSRLHMSDIDNNIDGIINTFTDYAFISSWTSDQSSSSDDELSTINELMGPDHLTRNE